ncbi:MAG: hypothetical protein DDT42_01803 [candidate division WS2 bacterium]|uniref:Uncharacterized protein n=1 Tax=Psychracetigena formicireducens TaxID=2986056 RepID=A0A9E2BHY1_PSYF1|nr:hypothetical protein [Candidatus Psychracetigena formicireducens]
MSELPKGGRGVKAPYQTVVIRVPKPVEEDVLELIANFRQGKSKVVTGLEVDGVIELAKSVLKEKKSAKASLTKLLQVLFNSKDISL